MRSDANKANIKALSDITHHKSNIMETKKQYSVLFGGIAMILIIIALLVTCATQAQCFPEPEVNEWTTKDKQLHFMASGAIFVISEQMLYHMNARYTNLGALGITLGIGLGKELIYDKKLDYKDMVANCAGIAVLGGINYAFNKLFNRDKRNRIFYKNGLVIRLN